MWYSPLSLINNVSGLHLRVEEYCFHCRFKTLTFLKAITTVSPEGLLEVDTAFSCLNLRGFRHGSCTTCGTHGMKRQRKGRVADSARSRAIWPAAPAYRTAASGALGAPSGRGPRRERERERETWKQNRGQEVAGKFIARSAREHESS